MRKLVVHRSRRRFITQALGLTFFAGVGGGATATGAGSTIVIGAGVAGTDGAKVPISVDVGVIGGGVTGTGVAGSIGVGISGDGVTRCVGLGAMDSSWVGVVVFSNVGIIVD